MDIYLNVYRAGGEVLVAACDKEILGKVFTEGELQLEVSKRFYCGELKDLKELSRILNEATIANLVGDKVVDYAVSCGLVSKENVLVIGGVKHAQFVVV